LIFSPTPTPASHQDLVRVPLCDVFVVCQVAMKTEKYRTNFVSESKNTWMQILARRNEL
jgi:hypothetical protein